MFNLSDEEIILSDDGSDLNTEDLDAELDNLGQKKNSDSKKNKSMKNVNGNYKLNDK